MGASNWAVCPRCMNRARAAEAAALAQVMASYGKVPVAEFDAARAAVIPVDPGDYRTFREDYEILGAGEGTVQVSYRGHCGACGLHLDFKDEHAIPGLDDAP